MVCGCGVGVGVVCVGVVCVGVYLCHLIACWMVLDKAVGLKNRVSFSFFFLISVRKPGKV